MVIKVKLVERCFTGEATIEFQMYEAAPSPAPPLPFFTANGENPDTDENAVAKLLAEGGAKHLLEGEGVEAEALAAALEASPAINKAVKAAAKSKTAAAMATNKEVIVGAMAAWETALADREFLAGSSFSLADAIAVADVRAAFEKILDPADRDLVPNMAQWYQRCYDSSKAMQVVWKDKFILCEETVLAEKKQKESKEEAKAREKAKKKARDAAKKAEQAAAPASATPSKAAPAGSANQPTALRARKEDDFGAWYSEIVVRSEMLSYYNIPGVYVLRPGAFCLWEALQAWFDGKIKSVGVENCSFPLFITKDVLEKEQEHVDDFAPEVAWVTHSGDTPLSEGPIALRPTSETAMYPYFKQWIQSHRDLPLKLNQWTNVVRWEIKQRTPFVRSREFLWQEGHTAHKTEAESRDMVAQALQWYRAVYEELLAVPVVPGWKSRKEKFAGADDTSTVEAFIPETGKGIQGATSHALGQNFSKMFGITFFDEAKQEQHAWQSSWGMTTRTIGVMVMTHGDNKGLVVPPRVAGKQAVIVPIVMADLAADARDGIYDKAQELAASLTAAGVKTHADLRDYTPGNKYTHWELRGVCVRLELGPKDLAASKVMSVRRDNGKKEAIAWADLPARLPAVLDEMQAAMFERASERVSAAMATAWSFNEFKAALAQRKRILAPWCDEVKVEVQVKAETTISAEEGGGESGEAGAKTLCIPFEQPAMPDGQMCIFAKAILGEDRPAKNFALWGRSY